MKGSNWCWFANNSQIGKLERTNYYRGSKFANKINAREFASSNTKQRCFEYEPHGSVAVIAWYNGVKFSLAITAN